MNFFNLLSLNDPEYLISSTACFFKPPKYLFLPEELCTSTYVQYFSSSLLKKQ